MKSCILVLTVVVVLAFTGCGGGSMSSPSTTTTTTNTTYTVSAVVAGLNSGQTVVLQDNGTDTTSITSDGNATVATSLASGSPYTVTISSQPSGENCTLGNNATGLVVGDVTIAVACDTPSTFSVSALVQGLASGATVVLEDNGTDNTTVTMNGSVPIATSLASGTGYDITISTQPSGQTCTLGSNAGGSATANVTVAVTCNSPNNFSVSASVSGLTSGQTLVLQDNQSNQLTFTANGTQTFSSSYASGASYSVSGLSQPTGEICTLGSNASGTISANVTVSVTCGPPTYNVNVLVSGLVSGTSLVLQDNETDNTTITANGMTTIASVASGSPYDITILTQPSGQTCTLSSPSSGTVTASVTVIVSCATTIPPGPFTLSVTVTGLASGATLAVYDNVNNDLTFTSNTTLTFASEYAGGATYTVGIFAQPTGQTCTLNLPTGTITGPTTVTAVCVSAGSFTISAAVTGLATGTTLELKDSVGDQLAFTSNITQTFATPYASGSTYSVTIFAQPLNQTCTLSANASGTITANVTVTVTCTSISSFTISATVTGLTSGTLVLQDAPSDQLTFTSNTTQTFATKWASGSTYTVSIVSQPAGETCTLSSNASGTITANITVTATCSSTTYTISAAVTGLSGTLKLQDNVGDTLTFTSNITQTFATPYASGSTYTVSVATQPTGQTCTLSSNASGTITSNITVTATCTTSPTYTISVAVTGLTGTLVMQDNVGDNLTFTTNNTQTFATSYASGSTYTVSVKTQPAGQTCKLSANASGTITSNITVTATCGPSSGAPTISVAVTGLSGTVVLQDDQGDTLTFTSNGTQTFATPYTSGASYTVNVTNQPSAQACIPTYTTGTINSDITINATCATGSTRQLGTITGVSSVSCSGSIKNGVCQQMTVSCPGVPDVQAYVKTNTPTGSSKGTATYTTGTDGNGLYESIFTYGSTAVGNVLDAGFTTVEISWGTPFNDNQPDGWVLGTGGVLAAACRYATVTQWIYNNIQNNTKLPYCATANSGGAGALAYALSQYNSGSVLSMAEVTSGPPPGRLDWGCGCQEGKLAVQCGTSSTLGTCFGTADAPVWDPAYNPAPATTICTDAVNGTLPPGGLNFFFGDSVEAPGAAYNFPSTYVNLVFGGADDSSAIPIGQDWFNNITTSKAQVCVPDGEHSMANTLAGAQQIANDLINLCKIQ